MDLINPSSHDFVEFTVQFRLWPEFRFHLKIPANQNRNFSEESGSGRAGTGNDCNLCTSFSGCKNLMNFENP